MRSWGSPCRRWHLQVHRFACGVYGTEVYHAHRLSTTTMYWYVENIPQRRLLFFGRADSIKQDESPFVAAMQYCSVLFLSMRVRFTRAVGVVRGRSPAGGARAGNYVMYRRSGNILYLSGHLPKAPDGTLTTGKVSCKLVVRHATYTSECVLRWRVLTGQTLTVVAPCVEDG